MIMKMLGPSIQFFMVILVVVIVRPLVAVPAAPPSSTLKETQRANHAAQAEYYSEQNKKLRKGTGFYEALKQNPASVLGVVGATLTAFVALITFFLNYRSTLRYQRDLQFYEALKRIGDNSPAIRASAATLLAEMAAESHRRRWSISKRVFSKSYLSAVLDQIGMSLLLEDDEVVLLSLQTAFGNLCRIDPYRLLRDAHSINLGLQVQMASALGEFQAVAQAGNVPDIWIEAETLTSYPANALQYVTERFSRPFSAALAGASKTLEVLSDVRRGEQVLEAYKRLRKANYRLWTSVRLIEEALRRVEKRRRSSWIGKLLFRSPSPIDLSGSFLARAQLGGIEIPASDPTSSLIFEGALLREANLYGAKLPFADFREAKLQGANLCQANLDGAWLWKAEIDKTTMLDGAEWWKADFRSYDFTPSSRGSRNDVDLIHLLRSREGDIPFAEAHRSVREVLASSMTGKGQVAEEGRDSPNSGHQADG